MNDIAPPFAAAVLGIGATVATDLWAVARKRLMATPMPDYALVGRWFGHMARGRFRHDAIRTAPAVPGEAVLGWAAHYAIGIGFAAALLWLTGPGWILRPTPWPALAFGLATVAAPFLLMQPGMGAGIAASRTPHPAKARRQSLATHAVFGAGLYASAAAMNLIMS